MTLRQAGAEPWVRWLLAAILGNGRLRVAENPGSPGGKGSAAGSALLAAAGSGQVHVLRCLLKAMGWSPDGIFIIKVIVYH